MRHFLKTILSLIVFALLLFGPRSVHAAITAIDLSGPGVTTDFDGWLTANISGLSGYPGFPGSGAWPSPIDSGEAGSGDATLNKTANGPGGGPYPGSGSIYFGGFSSSLNYNGGTLAVTDNTPVANLKTVVFQLEIGEAWTYDLWNDVLPVLSYNGGTQNLAANYSNIVNRVYTGSVSMPTGPGGTMQDEPLYNNTYALQWDLSGISEAITSFSISFNGVQHSQVYALQLAQSDSVSPNVVPEPSRSMLGLMAFSVLLLRRKRRPSPGETNKLNLPLVQA